ncbi:MAG: hypothetical protein IPM46_16830 [Flavobacteriales bacterium]|nr:hypothetical protein [Flavobacteriales bacterium]
MRKVANAWDWFTRDTPGAVSDPMFPPACCPIGSARRRFWPSGSPEVLAFLEDMTERFQPLEDTATSTKVGIGIATGADDVFITDDAHGVEPDRLIPLLTSADITTGHVQWQGPDLVSPWDEEGQLGDLMAYPKLKAYCLQHAAVLKKRHVAQKQQHRWYATIDKAPRPA